MEKWIFRYLEFLLPVHNCVIIPDFGGFIVNTTAVLDSEGDNMLPQYSIVFNPELRHDDGIIASYISKDENVSYNAACKKIKDSVKTIQADLKSGKSVICSNIGILTTDGAGNISFRSNRNVVYPAYYGLCPITIKKLSEISPFAGKEKQKIPTKYALSGIAATIAAILMFAVPIANVNDRDYQSSNKASFISSITIPSLTSSSSIDTSAIVNEISLTKTQEAVVESENKSVSTRTYYIIIGGEDDKIRAERLLNKIKSTDFPSAEIVETSNRYRVYTSSFEDKGQAESYLESFRKENPKYQTAWLFSKKSR